MKKKPCTRRRKITSEQTVKRLARIKAAIDALTEQLAKHPELQGVKPETIRHYLTETVCFDYRRDMLVIQHIESNLESIASFTARSIRLAINPAFVDRLTGADIKPVITIIQFVKQLKP